MKRSRSGHTIKQYAYATRVLTGGAKSKKEAALLSGYSMTMAENAKAKIENTEGYQNAIGVLAAESNNLLLGIMAEFKTRGLKKFSNADLVKALNAMTGAWDKIEERRSPSKMKTPEGNPLRGVLMRRVEEVSVIPTVPATDVTASASSEEEEDPNDF